MPLPALVKILIVFVGMLALARLRVPLGLAIVLGGGALDVWGGRSPVQVGRDLASALSATHLWLLVAVTALIVEFGRDIARESNAQAIIGLARRWGGRHGRLWSLMAVPSVIGLVPMPAGALFSAPLVHQAVSEPHWEPAWKAAINYWFRHVWEYWWPIYPVVIIGLAVFRMEPWQFMVTLMPFTPMTVAVGYRFLLRPHRDALAAAADAAPTTVDPGRLIKVFLPLGAIIACALLLPPALARVTPGLDDQTRKLSAMLIGMGLGLALILWAERGQGTPRLFSAMFKPHALNVMLTVGGVAVFQDLLEASALVPVASRELLAGGIPIVGVVALLPFLAGLVTGVASGFAGIAFPLVVGLLHAPGSGLTPLATLVLAFGFGYMGMMLSPIHLCLLVSRDYFSAALAPLYRQLVPCALAMLAFTLLLSGVFRLLGW